ncbi:MAG: hypothetical protein ABII90_04980 [Bacteroidota bacterium]
MKLNNIKEKNPDQDIPEFDFSEIFYHKKLIENKVFTQKEAREMFDILAEIQSTLKDKSTNTKEKKLSIYERTWYQGINELMNKIKESVTD